MRRTLPLALVAVLAVGCASTKAATPSATPTSFGAACSEPGLEEFLDDVQAAATRGVVDPDDDAIRWHTMLLQAGGASSADEEIQKATRAVEAYLLEAAGTPEARARGRDIVVAARNVVTACRLNYDIKVPSKTRAQPPKRPRPRPADDPRFASCAAANRAGYGPYHRGDAEYGWYEDRDGDGTVCE